MKLACYPEIHCAIRDAFLATFDASNIGYEPYGLIRLEINERERIKAVMVKPELIGYGAFLIARRDDDEEVVQNFEHRAESVMCQLEHQFIEWMTRQLR